MTWEQALQVIEQMQQQITQLTARSNATDAEHIRVHNELERTQAQLAQNSTTGGRGKFRLIDPKTMIPDKLGTGKAPWKQWAEDTRAYVAMLSPMLSQHLKTVEGRETKLEPIDFDAAAVPEHHAAQLSRYLSPRSEGHANTIVKASIERNEHPLETWRCLSWEYDPKWLGTELIELNELKPRQIVSQDHSWNQCGTRSLGSLGTASTKSAKPWNYQIWYESPSFSNCRRKHSPKTS